MSPTVTSTLRLWFLRATKKTLPQNRFWPPARLSRGDRNAPFAGCAPVRTSGIEIKKMYEADGQTSPVGPATAFWILLFGVPWYVKCQSALNQYWASKGAPAAV
jgi:hypothetical protein